MRTVLKTTNGIDDMYKITCENNDTLTVNSNHILTLYYHNNNKISWKETSKTWILKYFDGNQIIEKNICVDDKDEGYKIICDIQDNNSKLYNCSELIDIKMDDYLKLSKYNKKELYMIKNLSSIQWNKKDVKIDPYILGAWLGDNCIERKIMDIIVKMIIIHLKIV